MSGSHPQQVVEEHFQAAAAFWRDIYDGLDVYAVIHQQRRERALALVDSLALPVGAPVLEVGCGAGSTAVALAQRGLQVHASDPVARMLELTRQRAVAAGQPFPLVRADAHALPVRDGSMRLVLALGVIPWLHSAPEALREMARALSPGGYLVVTADNQARLVYRLDPLHNPRLAGARRRARAALGTSRLRRPHGAGGAPSYLHSTAEFDALLRSAGLEKVAGSTLGFGPFTVLGRSVLDDDRAVRLHLRLQGRADAGAPVLRSAGSQYLVLARKPPVTG